MMLQQMFNQAASVGAWLYQQSPEYQQKQETKKIAKDIEAYNYAANQGQLIEGKTEEEILGKAGAQTEIAKKGEAAYKAQFFNYPSEETYKGYERAAADIYGIEKEKQEALAALRAENQRISEYN